MMRLLEKAGVERAFCWDIGGGQDVRGVGVIIIIITPTPSDDTCRRCQGAGTSA